MKELPLRPYRAQPRRRQKARRNDSELNVIVAQHEIPLPHHHVKARLYASVRRVAGDTEMLEPSRARGYLDALDMEVFRRVLRFRFRRAGCADDNKNKRPKFGRFQQKQYV